MSDREPAPRTTLARTTIPAGSAAVLDADRIVKTYRRGWRRESLQVLTDANLQLAAGEVVGLAGENGSGKSTLMKILVGSLEKDSGRVVRHGSLGYCPQNPILYERLTCDEHFELFARAYGLELAVAERSQQELYDALGFDKYRKSRVEELSGGTRAKLNLGLALLHDRRTICRLRLGHLPEVLGAHRGSPR